MAERRYWLADAIRKAGISAKKLAGECDPVLTESYVYQIIRGEREPGCDVVRRIVTVIEAHGVEMSLHEVLGMSVPVGKVRPISNGGLYGSKN
jgi:hypothetical protein